MIPQVFNFACKVGGCQCVGELYNNNAYALAQPTRNSSHVASVVGNLGRANGQMLGGNSKAVHCAVHEGSVCPRVW